ncbi:MAG: isochorismatase family cysteine hydrolase [Deltaproteobacteria bacterium]|nr:isochorismatase family cysteine hydrolase [Deltaproteobacteria bacterium]
MSEDHSDDESSVPAGGRTSSGESDRALIVLDMTLDRFRGSGALDGAAGIVRFVQGELRYFRERGRTVVFANDETSSVVIQELTPRSDEGVLKKPSPSAFFATELDALLQRRRIRRVTLVGLETHTAVLLTAADALARGYEVVVPDPCVFARDVVAHTSALALLRDHWPRAWTRARTSEVTHPSVVLPLATGAQ